MKDNWGGQREDKKEAIKQEYSRSPFSDTWLSSKGVRQHPMCREVFQSLQETRRDVGANSSFGCITGIGRKSVTNDRLSCFQCAGGT